MWKKVVAPEEPTSEPDHLTNEAEREYALEATRELQEIGKRRFAGKT